MAPRTTQRSSYKSRNSSTASVVRFSEYWIPADDLAEFNANIVGAIEVVA